PGGPVEVHVVTPACAVVGASASSTVSASIHRRIDPPPWEPPASVTRVTDGCQTGYPHLHQAVPAAIPDGRLSRVPRMASCVPGTGTDIRARPWRRVAAGIVPRVRSALVLPEHVDTLILGGGTTGAVIAGLLAERSDETVLVLEAGPDYGPLAGGRWPRALVDASMLGVGVHDWGFTSGLPRYRRTLDFERARVIGGCSAHNGCAAIWGARADYDAWSADGNDGWSTDELLPYFRRANQRMRVTPTPLADLTPYQKAAMDALVAMGIPAT